MSMVEQSLLTNHEISSKKNSAKSSQSLDGLVMVMEYVGFTKKFVRCLCRFLYAILSQRDQEGHYRNVSKRILLLSKQISKAAKGKQD